MRGKYVWIKGEREMRHVLTGSLGKLISKKLGNGTTEPTRDFTRVKAARNG